MSCRGSEDWIRDESRTTYQDYDFLDGNGISKQSRELPVHRVLIGVRPRGQCLRLGQRLVLSRSTSSFCYR